MSFLVGLLLGILADEAVRYVWKNGWPRFPGSSSPKP